MLPDRRLLSFVKRRKRLSTTDAASFLRISRQAAHRKLRALADTGMIAHEGAGRGAHWTVSRARVFRYRTSGLAEDRVWTEMVTKVPAISRLPPRARSIATYGFTEMLNNAIEHSGSRSVEVRFESRRGRLCFEVVDAGVGAFEKVRKGRRLESVLDAVGELSKGKVTTAPAAHTGEGIFFTSRAVSRFELECNRLRWIVDRERGDMTIVSSPLSRGTRVRCEIPRVPSRSLEELFAEYTIDLEFARTRTVVRLFGRGVEFMSRSEARRLMQGLDRFQEAVLDFERVPGVGQGFADEVFRVWAKAHRATKLFTENAAPPVAFMIERSKRTRRA